MAFYAPLRQGVLCRDHEWCVRVKCPTLAMVEEKYTTEGAGMWLLACLHDVASYSGCRDKLTREQYRGLATDILNDFGYLKITELMLFFSELKKCRYGRFYGAPDPMTIYGALVDFNAGCRRSILERMECEAQHERYRLQRERKASPEFVAELFRRRAERERREEENRVKAVEP